LREEEEEEEEKEEDEEDEDEEESILIIMDANFITSLINTLKARCNLLH